MMSNASTPTDLEIQTGMILGTGSFSTVKEVTKIFHRSKINPSLMSKSDMNTDVLHARGSRYYDPNDDSGRFTSEGSLKCSMGSRFTGKLCHYDNCIDYNDGLTTRLVAKSLRVDLKNEDVVLGSLDLATEAKVLSLLSHPNIVKLRATVGAVGRPDYMLILDKFSCTLTDKLSLWKSEKRRVRVRALCGLGSPKDTFQNLLLEQLFVVRQIALAMEHLHKNNIIYRDLKPENIGFSFCGTLQVFDFGLARELTEDDLIQGAADCFHEYQCTGLTGTRRWMAPEVYLCAPYGYSADVFSFGLLVWSIFSLATPFERMSVDKHFQEVIIKNKRPVNLKLLSTSLNDMITRCWHPNKTKRLSFPTISSIITEEWIQLRGCKQT